MDPLPQPPRHSIFPATREEALQRWREFLPGASRYPHLRNRVDPGHPHVTRLSAALRYRTLAEDELIAELLLHHEIAAVEKLVQEIHWRTYWKGWLEQRPEVWQRFTQARDALRAEASPALLRLVSKVEAGLSGVAVMDRFAHELVQTGYLHNHARMWFASYWVHVLRLPWQLGADFFLRHLIDADAASNTLSWRWVAGLHTPGKTYLVRRSNIERWTAPVLLGDERGHERLDDAVVSAIELPQDGPWPRRAIPACGSCEGAGPGAVLVVHDDDLSVEHTSLGQATPMCVIQFAPQASPGEGEAKVRVRDRARADAHRRLTQHFACDVVLATRIDELLARLHALSCREVLAMAPFTGPLGGTFADLQAHCAQRGVPVRFQRRVHDERHLPLARRGFFDYWKAVATGLP